MPRETSDSSSRVDAAFGDRLRRLRLATGWTQVELAERAGVGKRSLEEYERGQLPRKAAPALARALEVSTHYLMHGVDTLEDRIERLIDEVAKLEQRQSQLEALISAGGAANRRIWYSLDATLRLLLTQVASDEVLSQLPEPPRLVADNGSESSTRDVERDVDLID